MFSDDTIYELLQRINRCHTNTKERITLKALRFSSNGYKTYIAKKVWGKGKKSLVLPSKHHIRVCLTAKIDEKTSFYKLFLIKSEIFLIVPES